MSKSKTTTPDVRELPNKIRRWLDLLVSQLERGDLPAIRRKDYERRLRHAYRELATLPKWKDKQAVHEIVSILDSCNTFIGNGSTVDQQVDRVVRSIGGHTWRGRRVPGFLQCDQAPEEWSDRRVDHDLVRACVVAWNRNRGKTKALHALLRSLGFAGGTVESTKRRLARTRQARPRKR